MASLDAAKPWTTKLSSAGLVYFYFGRDVIRALCPQLIAAGKLEEVYDKMYSSLVEEVDAVDNGISRYEGEDTMSARYTVSSTIGHRVGRLNPRWNAAVDGAEVDARFHKAMAVVGEEFLSRLEFFVHGWLPARAIVASAVARRFDVHESGEIIVLDQGCPWKEHLFPLEAELGVGELPLARPCAAHDTPVLTRAHTLPSPACSGTAIPIKYVVYDDGHGAWRVQAVPVQPSSFTSRKPLPEPWRGLRDNSLDSITGILGCIFVHASGFIGGHRTREGVLALAAAALRA